MRTAALTGYADLARSLGLDPTELLGDVGLTLTDLDTPDRWIAAAPAARLLELSARRAPCEDFGVRLAERRRLGSLGPISVVLRDEPDLRSAVDLLIRYERVYNEALHMRLHEHDELARITVWLEFGEPAPAGQALDLVMGAVVGIIRALIGNDWAPLSASFAHPRPRDPASYRRTFGPGVRFDQDFTGLELLVRDLVAPVLTSDASVRPYSRQFLDDVVAPGYPTFATQVSETVELLLPAGRCSLKTVSRYLGMRPRALQTLLAEDGHSFSAIVHATRARLVERYLPNDGYSVTEVSQLLGFGAPSAFTRWFQARFGTSPSEWRRNARAGSLPAAIGDGQAT
ncbi:AraC family transcriptional regulator [Geodermatophilus sp. CPCC 205761]|uniref:AraC family transcriptional regulator n=1 Tax=Geodermatophilus sp. CPCC 205761 TaxID=2936597 RepID=UPI003EEBB7D1